jgi:hypothetical protein
VRPRSDNAAKTLPPPHLFGAAWHRRLLAPRRSTFPRRPLSPTTTSPLAARRSIHRPAFLLSPIYDHQRLNAPPHLKPTKNGPSLPHGCLSSLHHRSSRTYRVAPNSSTLRNCDAPRALILCSYAPTPYIDTCPNIQVCALSYPILR